MEFIKEEREDTSDPEEYKTKEAEPQTASKKEEDFPCMGIL